MSYNSMIEIKDVLPRDSPTFKDSALIACALKNQQIHLIILTPALKEYSIIRTIRTVS